MKNQMINKILFHPIAKILLGTIALLLSVVLVKTVVTKPLMNLLSDSEVIIKVVVALGSSLTLIGTYFLLMRYYEKRTAAELSRKGALGGLSGGLILGFGVIAAEVGLLYLLGYYEVLGFNSFVAFLPSIAFILGGVILEELIFRGLLFRILRDWKGMKIALVVSALLFQLPHFMNPNEAFLPAVLGTIFGFLHALFYAYTDRLWVPIAFHFGWNLAQPFFGTTLSGIDGFDILIVSKMEGPELLTGSAFGIEDSFLSLVTLVVLCIVFYPRRGSVKK